MRTRAFKAAKKFTSRRRYPSVELLRQGSPWILTKAVFCFVWRCTVFSPRMSIGTQRLSSGKVHEQRRRGLFARSDLRCFVDCIRLAILQIRSDALTLLMTRLFSVTFSWSWVVVNLVASAFASPAAAESLILPQGAQRAFVLFSDCQRLALCSRKCK